MISVEVATVCSRIPHESYYYYQAYLDSLGRFGVTPTVLGLLSSWHGLITKPKRMRDWLRDGHCAADVLIWTDAFDVVFCASPDEVAQTWQDRWNGEVLYNAERGLFPRYDLERAFPECGTPWRYLNSGVIIGLPADILAILEWMPLDDTPGDCEDPEGGRRIEPNDQGWHQMAYSAQPVPMALDSHCRICQCFSGFQEGDFWISEKGVRNNVTDTQPMILHANGDAKNILLPQILSGMKLA